MTDAENTMLPAMMEAESTQDTGPSDHSSVANTDGAHSTSVDTGTSPSDRDGKAVSDDSSLTIAKKETRAVNTWRCVMMAVLVLCAVGVAVVTYLYVSNSEEVEFEAKFEDGSTKVFESLGSSLDAKLGAIDAFVVALVSHARNTNKTWPFVWLPDHAVRVSKIRSLSRALALERYHYVDDDQKQEWESFTQTHNGWVQEAIEVGRFDTSFSGEKGVTDSSSSTSSSSSIHYGRLRPVSSFYVGVIVRIADPSIEHSDSGRFFSSFFVCRYLPTWETYPMVPVAGEAAYNWDALQDSQLGPALSEATHHRRVIITKVMNFDVPFGASAGIDKWTSRLVGSDVDVAEPIIRFLYPILDTAADKHPSRITLQKSTVVGFLASTFFWRGFLTDILPEGQRGLVVVISNECNQTFTYQVNGLEAVYLGSGDYHDPQYDGMGHSTALNDLSSFQTGANSYTGLTIDDDFCAYTVSIYPSEEMEAMYVSSDPIIFTIAAVSIFAFTAIIFLAYDKLVSVRQEKVMKSAQKSNAIVSSLFPSNVRDRLLEDNERGTLQPTKTKLKTFLNDANGESAIGVPESKPIADLFTDCTVSFSDIANFTAWSSVREPGQVFTLLETVYGAFDQIAARRGVFKVEVRMDHRHILSTCDSIDFHHHSLSYFHH
jgi:Adenylate and Guanylate cyclase catalytic domain